MKSLRNLIFFVYILHPIFSGTTGKVTGLVTEKDSGAPLIGCNVMVMDSDLGTASNQDGEYFILNIPPGIYSVKFSMIGYETLILENVKISVDKTDLVNINSHYKYVCKKLA